MSGFGDAINTVSTGLQKAGKKASKGDLDGAAEELEDTGQQLQEDLTEAGEEVQEDVEDFVEETTGFDADPFEDGGGGGGGGSEEAFDPFEPFTDPFESDDGDDGAKPPNVSFSVDTEFDMDASDGEHGVGIDISFDVDDVTVGAGSARVGGSSGPDGDDYNSSTVAGADLETDLLGGHQGSAEVGQSQQTSADGGATMGIDGGVVADGTTVVGGGARYRTETTIEEDGVVHVSDEGSFSARAGGHDAELTVNHDRRLDGDRALIDESVGADLDVDDTTIAGGEVGGKVVHDPTGEQSAGGHAKGGTDVLGGHEAGATGRFHENPFTRDGVGVAGSAHADDVAARGKATTREVSGDTNVGERIDREARRTRERVEDARDQGAEAAENAGQQGRQFAKDAVEAGGEQAAHMVEQGEAVGDAVYRTGDLALDHGVDVVDDLGTVGESVGAAGGAVREVGEMGAEFGHGAADLAKDGLRDPSKPIQDARDLRQRGEDLARQDHQEQAEDFGKGAEAPAAPPVPDVPTPDLGGDPAEDAHDGLADQHDDGTDPMAKADPYVEDDTPGRESYESAEDLDVDAGTDADDGDELDLDLDGG